MGTIPSLAKYGGARFSSSRNFNGRSTKGPYKKGGIESTVIRKVSDISTKPYLYVLQDALGRHPVEFCQGGLLFVEVTLLQGFHAVGWNNQKGLEKETVFLKELEICTITRVQLTQDYLIVLFRVNRCLLEPDVLVEGVANRVVHNQLALLFATGTLRNN